MVTAKVIAQSTPDERRALILAENPLISTMVDGIERAQAIAYVLNTFVSQFLIDEVDRDQNHALGSILTPVRMRVAIKGEINRFRPIATASIKVALRTPADLIAEGTNIYKLCGASRLAASNEVTRNLSTTLGSLWERIASTSPYSVNPEIDFKVKLKGLDLISLNRLTDVVEYQQIKTQRNTLTGSQVPRSVMELQIHENPVFCACFPAGNWTFNHPTIPRIAGAEFWSRIGMDYQMVLEEVRLLMTDLEIEYVNMLAAGPGGGQAPLVF